MFFLAWNLNVERYNKSGGPSLVFNTISVKCACAMCTLLFKILID
jgi:hypothetical protein